MLRTRARAVGRTPTNRNNAAHRTWASRFCSADARRRIRSQGCATPYSRPLSTSLASPIAHFCRTIQRSSSPELSPTHLCLLNKYPVVGIIFVDRDARMDWRFYNSGKIAAPASATSIYSLRRFRSTRPASTRRLTGRLSRTTTARLLRSPHLPLSMHCWLSEKSFAKLKSAGELSVDAERHRRLDEWLAALNRTTGWLRHGCWLCRAGGGRRRDFGERAGLRWQFAGAMKCSWHGCAQLALNVLCAVSDCRFLTLADKSLPLQRLPDDRRCVTLETDVLRSRLATPKSTARAANGKTAANRLRSVDAFMALYDSHLLRRGQRFGGTRDFVDLGAMALSR